MGSNHAVSKLRLKKLTFRFLRFKDESDYTGYYGRDVYDESNPYAMIVEDYSSLQNLFKINSLECFSLYLTKRKPDSKAIFDCFIESDNIHFIMTSIQVGKKRKNIIFDTRSNVYGYWNKGYIIMM